MLTLSLTMILLTISVVFGDKQEKLSDTCLINKQEYSSGESFLMPIGEYGCFHKCICVALMGQMRHFCQKNCRNIDVPRGCIPKTGKCGCVKSYTCPLRNVCTDETTGLRYKAGKTWSNETCNCLCLGGPRGTKNCNCRVETEATSVQQQTNPLSSVRSPSQCVSSHSNLTCNICLPTDLRFPTQNRRCTLRRECEQWFLKIFKRNLNKYVLHKCTCYGPNSLSRCVPVIRRVKRFVRSSNHEETIIIEDSF